MYNSSEIAERIRKCAKQQGKSVSEMLSACELGKNTVTKLSNNTDILTLNFAKIADYLDCSVDYLLGRTDQKEMPTPVSGDGQDEKAQRFMGLVERLTSDQQELLLSQLQAWTEQNQRQALAAQPSDEEKGPESGR